MKIFKHLLIGLIVLNSISCAVTNNQEITKNQKKGTVSSKNFDYETEFTTAKTLLIIPAKVNGVLKNFLFDTGAQYSIIQRDSIIGSSIILGGASKRSIEAGSEFVESFKIGNVEFIGTVATNTNMVGLKEQVPNFGGFIGQPIIKKANWLIDYPNKNLRISNKNLSDETFKTIKIVRKGGLPYTNISINGIEYNVVVDFGSSSEFSLPKESKLAKQLLESYEFEDNERERWTIGGNQTIKEKVGNVPLIRIGEMEFENISTKINIQSRPRIGIGFFKDYVIYIDNLENSYKIKK